ncbi:MAG: M4 family metallopeptidase [candidate division Zixibacteria bacterium]|nr:M4 family metallopeptidase [candidate division Zixibacteria bacterium]
MSQPVAAGKEIATAYDYFEKNKESYKMSDPARELQVTRIERDKLGMTHIRLRQYCEGVRVIGGDLVAHFTPEGVLRTVNGIYHPFIDIAPVFDITAEEAVDIAVEQTAGVITDYRTVEPELVVFPFNDTYYLCWRMFLNTLKPAGWWEYYIDAKKGTVVFRVNRITTFNDLGTGVGVMGYTRSTVETNFNNSVFELVDSTRQQNNNVRGYDGQMPDGEFIVTYIAGLALPGEIAADADNLWDSAYQAAAVDAHIFTGAMYDWWLREFNRNSYDDSGATLMCIVDYSGEGYNNAYWDGVRIVVWQPSEDRRSLAGCPEVIAHEWAHAITEHTSELIYFKEPGALNESFSDMMGAAFEWAHDSLDVPDWLLGENSFLNGATSRNMAEPHNNSDPDYFGLSDPYWYDTEDCVPSMFNDYCGIHSNNGVGNKWFYLLSDGGTHHDVTVEGIGVVDAARVAYRANVFYWVSGIDFKNAALGTISAASDLDPSGLWAEQVEKAWQAVGVSAPPPKLLFSYPEGVPSLVNRNEVTAFEVQISGIYGGTMLEGSVQLHYSINNQPYTGITLTESAPGNYPVVLPALECDSTLSFYISAEEAATGIVYDPDTVKPHLVRAASETTVAFEDNFEINRGWTVTGDAERGEWSRALPYGGGYRTDPPTDFDGSGRCFLTGNGGGDTDVDGGTTSLISPTFDASDNSYEIHYARWYANDYSHAPHSDIMRVYVSSDDGQSWVLVEEIGPEEQASGGWFSLEFTINDFILPTAYMKLKFEVSDLGDGSVVEAAIDDVSVRAWRCREYICGDIDNSGGEPDISDITRVISHLYLGGAPLDYPAAANVDGSPDGTIDISDITYLIRYLYMGGSDLICE